MFGGALLGLGTLALAVKRILPVLFFLWSLVVVVMLVKGYVFSGYFFDSGEFRVAIWLTLGAVLAVAGAWYGMLQRT